MKSRFHSARTNLFEIPGPASVTRLRVERRGCPRRHRHLPAGLPAVSFSKSISKSRKSVFRAINKNETVKKLRRKEQFIFFFLMRSSVPNTVERRTRTKVGFRWRTKKLGAYDRLSREVLRIILPLSRDPSESRKEVRWVE